MKQTEVAELFNVTHFIVGNWENGHLEPKFCQIPILKNFLDMILLVTILIRLLILLLIKRRELGWTQKVAARNLGMILVRGRVGNVVAKL